MDGGSITRVSMRWKRSAEFPLSVVTRSRRGSWRVLVTVHRLSRIGGNTAENEGARLTWMNLEGESATISAVSFGLGTSLDGASRQRWTLNPEWTAEVRLACLSLDSVLQCRNRGLDGRLEGEMIKSF